MVILIRILGVFLLIIALHQPVSATPATTETEAVFDSLRVKAGSLVVLPDTIIAIERDTVLVIPPAVTCEVKSRHDLRSDALYDSLRAMAKRGRVSRTLYDALFVAAPKSSSEGADFTKSEKEFLGFEGREIRGINPKQVDTWAGSVNDTTVVAESGFAKTLNNLHTRTRDRVIHDNLLFDTGDILTPYTLADNERILRALPFIEDARIYVTPCPDPGNTADIVVVTKDVFPIGMDGSVDAADKFKIEVFDRNLFGMGHDLRYVHHHYADKDPVTGHEVRYTVSNIGRTFVSASAGYNDTWQKNEIRAGLSRQFLTPKYRYGGGLEVGRSSSQRDEISADTTASVDYTFSFQDIWAGRSFLLGGAKQRTNLILAARYRKERFAERPAVSASTGLFYHNRNLTLGSVALRRLKYLETSMLLGFGTTEDVAYGHLIRLTSGYREGEFENQPYLGGEIGVARHFNRLGYASLRLGMGGFLDNRRLEEGAFRATALYFTNLGYLADYGIRGTAKVSYTHGIRRLPGESISLKEVIRGISGDDPKGNTSLVLSLEMVQFAPWDFYRFRFAFFQYADLGLISPARSSLSVKNSYGAVGLGCRIRNESLVFSTFSFRVGYLLHNTGEEEPWDFNFATTEASVFSPIEVDRPALIAFQ